MKIKYLLLSVLMLSLWSCETDVVNPDEVYPDPFLEISSGDADFSTYVSMGGGLAAGWSDASLFMAGQTNSFPNIMAGVMSMAGGGEFTQPYVSDNVGGILIGGEEFWGERQYFDGAGPSGASGSITTEATSTIPGPYNNMAFPFVNAIHMVAPGYGNVAGLAQGLANPWYVRAASSGNASIIGDALAQQPTFVSVIPGDDFSAWALFGGPTPEVDLTSTTGMFTGVGATLQTLGASVPGGVVTNLPDPSNTATFNTVAYNSIPLDQATADMLNAAFLVYNGGLIAASAFGLITADEAAARTIVWAAGNNSILMDDEYLTDLTALGLPSIRQTNANDKINLFAAPFLGTTPDPSNPMGIIGITIPSNDFAVLSADEIATLQSQLVTANGAIAGLVPSGWALFDLHGLYNEIATTGVYEDEFNMTGDLVFGGFFGLDGYFPTSRGYALIAKRMMEAIDSAYGSNLSDAGLDIGDYPTNYPDGI